MEGSSCQSSSIFLKFQIDKTGIPDPSPDSLGQNLFRKPISSVFRPLKVRGTLRRKSLMKTVTLTEGAPHFKWSK